MRVTARFLGLIALVVGAIFLIVGFARPDVNTGNGNPSIQCIANAGEHSQDCSYQGDSPQEVTQQNSAQVRITISGGAILIAGAALLAGSMAGGTSDRRRAVPQQAAYPGWTPPTPGS